MIKLLFFGDVIGKPGRKVLQKALPELRRKYAPDFVVANVENIAHGKGVTEKSLDEIRSLGIDAYTSGNHVFDKGDLTYAAFDTNVNLIRPANYALDAERAAEAVNPIFSSRGKGIPGNGSVRIEKNGQGYLVINLNGQVFFERQFAGKVSSPFAEFDELYRRYARSGDIVIVDFHAEATSEKRAFGFYVDGRAHLVCGTHTHVPTADIQILPKGTAYVTDVGMIGALNSILGVPVENSLQIFLNGKFVYEVEDSNPIMLNAVYAEIADGRAINVQKVYEGVDV